jgi:nicotinate (nicotinamide) nucleotide adenylyltransferase
MRQLSLRQQIEALLNLKKSSILITRKASQGISRGPGRLGIFPASFNPPTRAHLALIRKASRQGRLDEILVLLDAQAMDKKIIGAKLEDRLTMLEILFRKDTKVSIGICNRGLFVEKLLPLKKLYPRLTSFVFVVGFDTILRVMNRNYYRNPEESLDELFRESCFLVANRGERDRAASNTLFGDSHNKKYGKKVSFLILPRKFSSVSSSLVRNRLRQGNPVNDLVPTPVLRFIEETGLYSERL